MKFLITTLIGFILIAAVWLTLHYYWQIDRHASRLQADAALQQLCQEHRLTFIADHQGVAAGNRYRYTWRVKVALLSPSDQAITHPILGRLVLRRNLPLEKRILFDFERPSGHPPRLLGFHEEE